MDKVEVGVGGGEGWEVKERCVCLFVREEGGRKGERE